MARKRIDWLDFAHELDREREHIRERLPAGFDCTLSLRCDGYGGQFCVSLDCPETRLTGWGMGRTPAKALEAATADLRKKAAEQNARPRIVAAEPAALPPANRTLFG